MRTNSEEKIIDALDRLKGYIAECDFVGAGWGTCIQRGANRCVNCDASDALSTLFAELVFIGVLKLDEDNKNASEYRIATDDEKTARDCYEGYELLIGPNGFECALTEPEDRTFYRDLKPIIEELNRLSRKS